jgi:hypothetical protein
MTCGQRIALYCSSLDCRAPSMRLEVQGRRLPDMSATSPPLAKAKERCMHRARGGHRSGSGRLDTEVYEGAERAVGAGPLVCATARP